jgi:DNA-directed RNA polymerase specialized sigma subunit
MEQFDINDIEYPLDITEQYFRDIAEYSYLVRLPKDLEIDLAERASNGDADARELIILSGLAYVVKVASKYFHTLATHHDEFLDIVSVGHLELVEMIDIALTKQNPFSYLNMRAKFAIRDHCYYSSDIIARPEGMERKKVVSLDVLQSKFDFDPPIPEETALPDVNDVNYEALYEAIGELTERQREVLIRHYGLFGQPEEQLPDINRIAVSGGRNLMALKNLRKKLADLK